MTPEALEYKNLIECHLLLLEAIQSAIKKRLRLIKCKGYQYALHQEGNQLEHELGLCALFYNRLKAVHSDLWDTENLFAAMKRYLRNVEDIENGNTIKKTTET